MGRWDGSEELEQVVGDLEGLLQRGPVTAVVEDLEGGRAVRLRERLADGGGTDAVAGSGEQE